MAALKTICAECGHDFGLGDNQYGIHECPQCLTPHKLHVKSGWSLHTIHRLKPQIEVKSQGRTTTKLVGPEIDLDLKPGPVVKSDKPDAGLVCSFCKKPTDLSRATFGQSKPRKIISERILKDPVTEVMSIEEKITHVTDKLVACPDCCLEIKPVMEQCRICKGKGELRYMAEPGAPIAPCKFCRGIGKVMAKPSGNTWPEFD